MTRCLAVVCDNCLDCLRFVRSVCYQRFQGDVVSSIPRSRAVTVLLSYPQDLDCPRDQNDTSAS